VFHNKYKVTISFQKPCLCVAIDPKGSLVAVGTTVGRIIIMDAMSGMHISSLQASVDQLGCIAFSPEGNLLAVGSHDHGVYIYAVLDEGQCLRKHKSGILTVRHFTIIYPFKGEQHPK
jgi:microtubule-associated protein-like 1/2